MRFFVLGHLEIVEDGRQVPLVGFQQRAVLGYLLLNANQVVSVDQLVEALWGEDSPLTARKMLQNAVSGLRRVLRSYGGSHGAHGAVELDTRPPGYLLRVEPDLVDLTEFHRLAERGRADLADQQWESAAQVLRDALALWRGPMLGDLVGAGLNWPEIAAAENTRLAAFEDCVEAELARGRHHAVISELEAVTATEPTRERLCGQLMLALYRCGRQADALNAYLRTRAALVENFGLDPGRELRELEQAILAHDPALALPASATSPAAVAAVSEGFPSELCVERKHISVLAVVAQPAHTSVDDDPEHFDAALQDAAAVVCEEVGRAGGTVTVTVGPMMVAVFGAPHTHEDDAVRAVRAALAIRDAFRTTAPARLTVRAAVTSGEALVRWWPNDPRTPPVATGGVLDRALGLVSRVPSYQVRVCPTTWQTTEHVVDYTSSAPPGYEARAIRPRQEQMTGPFLERERELTMLDGLLRQVVCSGHPHLVTVLGDAGIGKSRLVREFHAGCADRTVLFGLTDDLDEVEATAARGPLVLVVEDAHDADEATLDRLDDLTERVGAVPLLVVVTARPELLQRRTRWSGGKRSATTVTLDPLSDYATAVLMKSLLGEDIPADIAATVFAHVAGNPLFAAEYVAMLRDGVSSPLRPPRSVHNVIASRLDTLPAADKSVLQDAALFGERVWPSAVAAVGERDHAFVAESLERLARKEFLVRTRTSTEAGEPEYVFRHVLIRDVACSQLPRSSRATRHLKS